MISAARLIFRSRQYFQTPLLLSVSLASLSVLSVLILLIRTLIAFTNWQFSCCLQKTHRGRREYTICPTINMYKNKANLKHESDLISQSYNTWSAPLHQYQSASEFYSKSFHFVMEEKTLFQTVSNNVHTHGIFLFIILPWIVCDNKS